MMTIVNVHTFLILLGLFNFIASENKCNQICSLVCVICNTMSALGGQFKCPPIFQQECKCKNEVSKHGKGILKRGQKMIELSVFPRIVRGLPAHVGQFPFQVTVRCSCVHFCGGVIYNPRTVITAGHCCDYIKSNGCDEFHIFAGSIDLTTAECKGPSAVHIKEMKLHPNFDFEGFKNDICALHLKFPLEFSDRIASIPLGDVNSCSVGTKCSVSGWGSTETGSKPKSLLYVDLPILDDSSCAGKLRWYNPDIMTCAGHLVGVKKGTCIGDSGGGLVCNGKLCGIVSFGRIDCATVDAFVKIPVFSNWIKENAANP